MRLPGLYLPQPEGLNVSGTLVPAAAGLNVLGLLLATGFCVTGLLVSADLGVVVAGGLYTLLLLLLLLVAGALVVPLQYGLPVVPACVSTQYEFDSPATISSYTQRERDKQLPYTNKASMLDQQQQQPHEHHKSHEYKAGVPWWSATDASASKTAAVFMMHCCK